jgi:hypothetical protein
MRARPWVWLETHIAGLLAVDSRLSRALTPKQDESTGMRDLAEALRSNQ